jgi:hypothetical protein
MLVMSRIEETGFVIAGTLFGREDHTGGRITIVASQAPLIPAAGPNGAVVEVFESDFSLLMFVHIVTSDAIFIVNRSAYMAGAPAKISARSDNLSAKTLLLTVTARTQAITGGETVLVSMASRAVAADLMLVVRGAVIGMMFGLSVTGLADAGPRRVAFAECKMFRIKLEEHRVRF